MSKYTRKQRQAPQDEFVGFWDKVFKKAEPYARAIGITVLTAGVLIVVVWGVMSWMEHKSQAATEAFGHAVRVYEAELHDRPTSRAKTDEENPVPRFKTEKERAEATLKELDEFDKKYGHSSTADEAMLFRAGVYYDLGRFDDAADGVREVHQGRAPVAAAARRAQEGSGLCREQQGKLDEALAQYQAARAQDRRLLSRPRAVGRGARVDQEGRQEEGGRAAQGARRQDAVVAAQGRGADADRAARGDVRASRAHRSRVVRSSGCVAASVAAARAVPGGAGRVRRAGRRACRCAGGAISSTSRCIEYKPQEFASAASDGTRVFIGSSAKVLWALSARDGSILWNRTLGGAISGRPLYVGGDRRWSTSAPMTARSTPSTRRPASSAGSITRTGRSRRSRSFADELALLHERRESRLRARRAQRQVEVAVRSRGAGELHHSRLSVAAASSATASTSASPTATWPACRRPPAT